MKRIGGNEEKRKNQEKQKAGDQHLEEHEISSANDNRKGGVNVENMVMISGQEYAELIEARVRLNVVKEMYKKDHYPDYQAMRLILGLEWEEETNK